MVILLYLTIITLCDWPAKVHPGESCDECSFPALTSWIPATARNILLWIRQYPTVKDLLLLWSFKWTLQVTSLKWIFQRNFIIVYLRGFSCIRRIFDRKNQVMKPLYWLKKKLWVVYSYIIEAFIYFIEYIGITFGGGGHPIFLTPNTPNAQYS